MIYAQIIKSISIKSGVNEWICERAIKAKLQQIKEKKGYTHEIYDPMYMNEFKALIGGRVNWIMTGAAPMEPTVKDFLKATLCCPITEGFGMTESSGGGVFSKFDESDSFTTGGPTASTKIRLRDLPEHDYRITSDPPTGELVLFS